MLKKTIEYEDLNGMTVVDDFYFHLSKAELVKMEMSHKGGLHEHLQNIVDAEDGKAIIEEFERLILESYGKKSLDGRRFIKTQELRDEFQSSEAYSVLFMELCTKADKAAEFVNGIIPDGLEQDIAKLTKADPTDKETIARMTRLNTAEARIAGHARRYEQADGRELTLQEATSMDEDELRDGLASGKYKLSDKSEKFS